MKRCPYLLVIVAAVSLLSTLAAACGGDDIASDPFVGTWRVQERDGSMGQTPIVITKTDEGYLATFVYWGSGMKPASPRPTLPIRMERSGNFLVGTFGEPALRAEIAYQPESDKATWANSRTPDGPLNKPDLLVKVSEGTAYPTTL
jgi:hypothetical protein